MEKTTINHMHHSDTAAIAAGICGVSDNLVRKVMRGDRENEVVLIAVMELTERKLQSIEEVTKIVEGLQKNSD